LARVRRHTFDRYTAEELPDGTLVLTPAVTISAVELAALRDPVVRAAVVAAKSSDRSEFATPSETLGWQDYENDRLTTPLAATSAPSLAAAPVPDPCQNMSARTVSQGY
jgi:hypothetical protein